MEDIKEIDTKSVIGTIAVITGIISFIPILYKIILTHKTANFTYINLFIALLSNTLWIYYGYLSNTPVNKWSGLLYLFIYGTIVYYKIFT